MTMESSVIFHVKDFTRLLATSWLKRSVRTDKDAAVIGRGVGRSRKDKHFKKYGVVRSGLQFNDIKLNRPLRTSFCENLNYK